VPFRDCTLQKKTRKAKSETEPTEHCYLGDSVSTGATSFPANSFSALDTIDGSSKISMSFSFSAGRLSGVKIDYSDNKHLTHGVCSSDKEAWNCEVKVPIVAA
jgi:hypothetical protein